MSKEKYPLRRKIYGGTMHALMYFSVFVTCALVVAIIGYVLIKGLPNITWKLLSTKPSYLSNTIGILPDILNTIYIVLATLVVVLPLGVGAAIYLTEYASNKKIVGMIEYAAETLSGIPSIIYGLVGMLFFCQFLNADCDRIAIENPVGIISGDYVRKYFPDIAEQYGLPVKPTQKIHPWQFGDSFEKTTCLWLRGLQPLTPTNIVDRGEFITHKSGKVKPKWFADAFKLPPEERSKVRSKTFPGIAKAMAEQWG